MLIHIVSNFKAPKGVRIEKLEGEDHYVAPIAMLAEGVWEGDKGPLFYPGEELNFSVPSWDHRPMVAYHPQINGEGVSAADPTILNNHKMGITLSTKYDGKLRTEGWFNIRRTKEVDPRVIDALENGKMMEVSTGVRVRSDGVPGEWNGKKYIGTARNHVPDHLAILPDKIGAYSIKDGAGLLQLNEKTIKDSMERIRRFLILKGINDPEPVINELSFGDLSQKLFVALRASLEMNGQTWDGWIEDIFPEFVVYFSGGKLYKQDYESSDTGVSLNGKPEEVARLTKYQTTDGSVLNQSDNVTDNGEKEMADKKKTMVDALIGNGQWEEAERELLMNMSEKQLAKLTTPPKVEEPKKQPAAPVMTSNVQDYIKQAPPEIQEVLNEGIASRNHEKQLLVNKITAVPTNIFNADYLMTMQLNELRGIAALIPDAPPEPQINNQGNPPMFDYSGVAGGSTQVANSAPQPLKLPSLTLNARGVKNN